ncbi:MAG: ammonia-forming cytochrome c nitrite reductase subunit c552 [Planctomycetes bacterium]|nr:ammonia-forming cytochrome c nitrite reductase subunit c552 [Planctomycetota bacterium]
MTGWQEVALVVLAAAGLAAPLLARVRPARARVAVTALTIVALALAARHLPRRAGRPAAPDDRPRVALRDGAWAGSDACKACHPGEHASWHGSYHRSMTQRPSSESVLADFEGVTLTAPDGARWRLSREGERFFAAVDDGPAREVVLVTGSHHMQVYWVADGRPRLLAQVPFVWLVDDGRWVPRNAAFVRPPELAGAPPSETGRWNLVCLRCHTTDPQSLPLSPALDAFDTRVGELGISCESCHGPGAEHVAANHDPTRRYALHLGGGPDPTIVNPARLDALRSSQVCGQCHSISCEPSEAEWRAWAEHGFSFRPGDDLSRSRTLVQPPLDPAGDPLAATILRMDPHFVEDRFWPDGEVRVTGRELSALVRSPCFKGGELSCVTCHALHKAKDDPRPVREWANDQLRPQALGDAACASCHQATARAGEEHTRHPAGAGVGCMDCHMPHTTYGLLKAIRSHEVTSPDVGAALAARRPNACNLCHLDRSIGWAADALAEWTGAPAPALGEDEREVAAGPLWLLTGDAGVRALVAWATGQAPARAAAGTWWLPPYLEHVVRGDPYDAVRIVAWRALRDLPEAEGLRVDPVAAPDARARALAPARERWPLTPTTPRGSDDGARVLAPGGRLDRARFQALSERRDDRRVDLIE